MSEVKQEIITKEEVTLVKTKIDGMKAEVEKTKVTNEEELRYVATFVDNIKKLKKYVEQVRDRYIKPAKEIIESAKEQYDPYIEQCKEAEAQLKKKAEVFMIEQKRIEDEKKAKEIKKVETGYQKPETAAKKIDEIPEAKKSISNDNGGKLSMKMVKDIEIVDEKLIPEEYYKPRELDMVKIKKVATAGVVIPGVKVVEKPQMSSR